MKARFATTVRLIFQMKSGPAAARYRNQGCPAGAIAGRLAAKALRILAGSLQLDSRLTAMPLSRAGILKTLSGNLQFSVSGMVIDEMNIEKRVCEAAAQLDGKSLSAKQWSEKTELRDTRGTAQLQNGIMFLSPLAAKLDTLDLNGIGPVNLLDNTMDLKLDLKAVDDRQAVNACEIMNPRLAAISWPLRCRGNFSTQAARSFAVLTSRVWINWCCRLPNRSWVKNSRKKWVRMVRSSRMLSRDCFTNLRPV